MTVVDESPGILSDVSIVHDDPGGATPPPGEQGSKPTRILRRYEVVIAAVGAIVLIVRLAGGGFTANLSKESTDGAAAVAPFTEESAPAEVPAAETPEVTFPPSVEAAVPSGSLPADIRTRFTPTTARPAPRSAAGAIGAVAAGGAAPAAASSSS